MPSLWPLRQDSDAEQSLRMLYSRPQCVRARVKASRWLPWSKFLVSYGACDHLRPKVAKSQIPAPPSVGALIVNGIFWYIDDVSILEGKNDNYDRDLGKGEKFQWIFYWNLFVGKYRSRAHFFKILKIWSFLGYFQAFWKGEIENDVSIETPMYRQYIDRCTGTMYRTNPVAGK